ncbi:MAG: SDR family oxidoreductase [Vicinamibacterales bacterium]
MSSLKSKTLFITGASRGIGKAIALRAAADGANIVIVAKTAEPHPKLPGTIFTTAEDVERAGGRALPLQVDIRDEAQVEGAVSEAARVFGGIDVLINNASAIGLTGTLDTPMKRFDLMHGINVRGTFLCSQKCLPLLRRSANPHILTMAPPLNIEARWFAPHVAYSTAKFGMSLCVLGMAEEFKGDGVAVNALWPRTAIETAAIGLIAPSMLRRCRTPAIMADAAYSVITRPSRSLTGQFLIDEDVLRADGVTDFSRYRHPDVAEEELMRDLFV